MRTVLYIGVTNDLIRRVFEHRARSVKGFTSQYQVMDLIHYEIFSSIKEAITREKQLKGWRREKKEKVIEETNPEYKDLSYLFNGDPSTSSG